ncbi:3'-5' RNA helicase YTHDC2-like [Wyeomyia smithii]|uniref:3'-5' RNA helicase YTHDC2-like n=1 Tax=Wyeomyia smithii TaxID=174621 RepID=UPI002467F7AF|nr:3'-5' RNA helicase YTHDC2-like [Wyeomyia smithii]
MAGRAGSAKGRGETGGATKTNNVNIEEDVRIAIHYMIDKFVQDEKLNEFDFPASFTREHRAYIHDYVKNKSLKSRSHGKGNLRYLTIYKSNILSLIHDDASLNMSENSSKMIQMLLHKQGGFQKEIAESHARRKIFPCLTAYSLNLGSPNNSVKCIPPPSNSSMQVIQERLRLPIAPFREAILNCLNQNQVMILSGSTGSGKTTQIPQYILESSTQRGESCRIICTQPRRLSAITVADRVSFERNEPVGQTVGYQIRLESRLSPVTNLIFCTNGVLLRCLMGKNANSILNDVTHIIVDEVHERDQYSDFLLISLKEKVLQHTNIKIILMSATIESNTFSRYFNNSPLIEIPGRLFPIENYYLEDVLFRVDSYNAKINDVKRQFKSTPDFARAMCQNQQRLDGINTANMDDETILLMNDILELCWIENNPEDFNHFFYLVEDENNPINFQHTETKMTALMIAAAKGYTNVVKRLLDMGADPSIKGKHNYTALDWSLSINGYSGCCQLLEMATNPQQQLQQQALQLQSPPKQLSKVLLDVYHSTVNDEKIDHRLILDIILYICTQLAPGAILVFLPGYDDILEQYETLSGRLNGSNNFRIYMLHSNMQTNDQNAVFKPVAPSTRKIILSTNIAETSITIDDVVYVIDSGKVKQKHYDSVTSTTSLTATWISQACATQRAGRAGRTKPGICFRLFTRQRFESMDKFTLPEILRVPLTEICLQTSIIASHTSILNFLSKAIQPPSPMSIKQSIKLLQKLGALDDDENLTELGLILADLPVDARFGKILLYGIFLKCIDPILTIVSALSVNDPFILPTTAADKDRAAKSKRDMAEDSYSDCLCLLRAFQKWNEVKPSMKERQFCNRYFLNSGTMDTIASLRSKILGHLRSVGLVKSYGPGNIQDLNQHSDSWAVVKACLVAGLYPNVCRVDKENATIKTRIEKKISPHPSSVIRDKSLKKNKESILSLPSEWIVFEEKTRAGAHCLIKCNTVVAPVAIALFCGPLFLLEEESLIHWKDLDESNSDNDEHDMSDKSKLIIDDWINFAVNSDFGMSVFHFRHKLSALFLKFISNPRGYQPNANDLYLLNTVARLLEEEERHLGFAGHTNIGQKPRPVIQNHLNLNNGAQNAFNFSPNDFKHGPSGGHSNNNNNNNGNHGGKHQNRHQNQQHHHHGGGGGGGVVSGGGGGSSNKQHQNNNNHNKKQEGKVRYFVVHAASVEQVQQAADSSADGWSFNASLQPKLTKLLKKSSNLSIILFFHISQSKCFYGTGRLTLVSNQTNLNIFSRNTVSFDTLSNFEKSFLRGRVLEQYLDGEELSPLSGHELLEYFK